MRPVIGSKAAHASPSVPLPQLYQPALPRRVVPRRRRWVRAKEAPSARRDQLSRDSALVPPRNRSRRLHPQHPFLPERPHPCSAHTERILAGLAAEGAAAGGGHAATSECSPSARRRHATGTVGSTNTNRTTQSGAGSARCEPTIRTGCPQAFQRCASKDSLPQPIFRNAHVFAG